MASQYPTALNSHCNYTAAGRYDSGVTAALRSLVLFLAWLLASLAPGWSCPPSLLCQLHPACIFSSSSTSPNEQRLTKHLIWAYTKRVQAIMRPSADQAEQLPLLGDAHNAANQRTIKRQKIAAVVLVFTLISIVAVGGSIIGTSANKLIEWNICRDKYPDRVVDDPRCGDREIAGRFAYIDGLLTTFQKLPGILCGIPYGLVADRWGRRRSLTLCMFGLTMMMVHIVTVRKYLSTASVHITTNLRSSPLTISFIVTLAESHHLDLRWIWACGLWMMIGGGFPVLNSTIFAVLNDVATPETR